MKLIYKYPVELQEVTTIKEAIIKPLTIQMQDGKLMLWAEVDKYGPVRPIIISCIGTGFMVSDNIGEYLCSVQQGAYVWHFYCRFI